MEEKTQNAEEEHKNQMQLDQEQVDKRIEKIKNKIVILSGKGGVGKSTVSANIAVGLALNGYNVGLLDIDVHGPSIPKLLKLEGHQLMTMDSEIQPIEFSPNLKIVSLGFLLKADDDAIVWRGPLKHSLIKQFLKDVNWGELDYLVIDSPPGTGDEPLSIAHMIKNPTGAVIVTSPQDIALIDVKKAIKFCHLINMPVLGLIENMSGFICPHCNKVTDIFKSGGGSDLAKNTNLTFLGKIPIDPNIVKASDEGTPFIYNYAKTETGKLYEKIVEKLIDITGTK